MSDSTTTFVATSVIYPKVTRPSKECVDHYLNASVFTGPGHMENIIQDFEAVVGEGGAQNHIDLMFSGFVAGMLNITNPDSNFNRKYGLGSPGTMKMVDELLKNAGLKNG